MAKKIYVGMPTKVKKTYTITNMIGAVASFEYDVMSSSNEGYVYCNTQHVKYGERALLMTGSADSTERTYVVRQKSVGYIQPTLTSTHKYYVRVETYQTTKAGTVDLYWPIAEPSLFSSLSGPANKWNTLSAVVDRSSFPDGNYQFRVDYNNQNSTAYMWFDGLMLVDLTETFGSGNEPDKDWCDSNIAFTTSTTTAEWWDTALQPIARNVNKTYVGVDGVARKVSKGYVGVDGVARQFYQGAKPITFILYDYETDDYFYNVPAFEGMTWEEWCDSSYNNYNITYDVHTGVVSPNDGYVIYTDHSFNQAVMKEDIIEADHTYVIWQG